MAEITILPNTGMVTLATFAKIVGVSEGAVEKTLKNEGIKTLQFQKGSSKWLISLSAVNKYLESSHENKVI